LPERAEVTVRLYDVLGRAVLTSAPAAVEAGAARAVAVDVSALPAGVYVYRVEAASPGGAERASGRLTVVR
ncbi:MAG TPA: T9SS type A sorting domain-containing protein, partial [Acidimicrobiales bacterium]|nr:T9SS type A sorting domain-containing protein [Acidimicrobiales bacterium]